MTLCLGESRLSLRPGSHSVLQKSSSCGSFVCIVSMNWSTELIQGALESGGPSGQLLSELQIYSNELEMHGDRSNGKIVR